MNPTDSGQPVRYLQSAVELNIGLTNCNWVFLWLKAPCYKSLTFMQIVDRTKSIFSMMALREAPSKSVKEILHDKALLWGSSVKFGPKRTQRTNHIFDNKLRGRPTFVGSRVLKRNLTVVLLCSGKQVRVRKIFLSQVINYGMLW